jgi:hypothetical protein
MHVYATARLYLSDAEAYLRITAARLSRRFPVVLDMLADGRLHLSAIARLAPHLRVDNADTLLARAAHRSKREVELLVAKIAPRPDAPSRMRRLPTPPAARPTVGVGQLVPDIAAGAAPDAVPAPPTATPAAPVIASSGVPTAVTDMPVASAIIAPLAPARYKVQFTAGTELHEKITRAQGLLRHQIPDGDLGAVFDRAMTLLIRELERARFAATNAPRKSAHEADPTPASRRIPDPIRRTVWTRDAEQCTYRDRSGRRCPARERLEFHHLVPFGKGGDHSPSNVTLRCAAHNALQADLDFGAAFMAGRRQSSRARERQARYRVVHAATPFGEGPAAGTARGARRQVRPMSPGRSRPIWARLGRRRPHARMTGTSSAR